MIALKVVVITVGAVLMLSSISASEESNELADILEIVRHQNIRLEQQEKRIQQLEQLIHEHQQPIALKETALQENESGKAITLPASCLDLWTINRNLTAGLYTVMVDNKIKYIYCSALTDLTEVSIGYVDVKVKPVYFYCKRPGDYKNDNNAVILDFPSVVTYHPAMNSGRGIFTAPVAGVYQFNYHGHAYVRQESLDNTEDQTRITLLKNSVEEVASNYAYSWYRAQTPLSFTAIIDLNVGDWIEVRFDYGHITDSHFSGILLEEILTQP